LSLAQQINSVLDVFMQKTRLVKVLHDKSMVVQQRQAGVAVYWRHIKPAWFFLVSGLVFYCGLNFLLWVMSLLENKTSGLISLNLDELRLFVALLFGQPIFSTAAAYVNGLFYATSKSHIAVINGVSSSLIGLGAKFLAVLVGIEAGIPLAISMQFLVAYCVLLVCARKITG
jgi:hypothetical protein